ncbi:hypothetical protein D5086_004336, partial [Populus alba]
MAAAGLSSSSCTVFTISSSFKTRRHLTKTPQNPLLFKRNNSSNPTSHPFLPSRKLCTVQATILREDEEKKVVVEESFQPKTFTHEPVHGSPQSSSPSGLETWAIKLEQSVNVFLTDSVIKILDTLYHDRDYARFFVLETIARVPYFAFISVLHMYESFGWWRRADYLKVHFAESWNEMHHLLIMEELGGNSWWFDRLLAQVIATSYYFMTVFMYALSPRMAYHFSECVESHAFATYDKFIKARGDDLKKLPAPEVAVKYYTEGDLYLFVELNLDNVNISAQGSNWCEVISHVLPNLRVLSLSASGLSGPLCSSLSKLHFLSQLHLDCNSELSSIPPSFLANSFNLETLDLSYCGLNGSFPNNIFLLPKLQYIGLSENLLLSGQFPEFSLNSSIQYLSLRNTSFSGNIPLSISNLKSLKELDLSRCKFYGVIPPSLANLTQLEALDLSFNSFDGSIPPFQRDGVANLLSLSLQHNQLKGILYSSLFTLPSLQNLDLSSNQLSGHLDEFSDGSSSLVIIELSNNNLSGSIPRSIFKLPSLIDLNLLYNKFSGPLKLGDFKNQRNLEFLAISDLSNNRIQGSFPEFIKNHETLVFLDLSDNKLGGQIPKWIWNMSLKYVNLSCNKFDFLDQFSNPISLPYSDTLITLDLHANKLPGSFPKAICNCSQLSLLDMSHNQLRREIPDCLGKVPTLTVLNLQGNNFDSISSYAIASNLLSLKISDNRVEGKLPSSLANCSKLEVLDLGGNMIRDTFP